MHWSEAEFQGYLHRRARELLRHLPEPVTDSGAVVLAEAGLLEHIRALARRSGWLCYHTHDSRRSEAGFPDLVLTNGQRVLFLECKTSTGKLTPEQARWLALLAHSTQIDARVVRPQDLGAIEEWLRGTNEERR